MAEISKITLPSGTTYDIKDTTARELISSLSGETVVFLGVTTSSLSDGSNINPIVINGATVTAIKGNVVTLGSKEFIFNGSIWQEFGDLSGLGALANKNSASGNFTPAGIISTPTITIITSTNDYNGVLDAGTLPSLTATVSDENLTITFSPGSLPTLGSETFVTGVTATASQPLFTGSTGTISVS